MKLDAKVWKVGLGSVAAVAKKTALCEGGDLVRLFPVDGGIELLCTNGSAEARRVLPVDGQLDRQIHVHAAPLLEFIGKAPATHVDLRVSEGSIRITYHGSSMQVSIVDAELPEMAGDPQGSVEVPPELLVTAIKAVRYVASNDPADAALHGVEVAVGDRIIRTRAGSREGRIAECVAGDGNPASLRPALISPSSADHVVAAAMKAESVNVAIGDGVMRMNTPGGLSLLCRTFDRRMHDLGAMLDVTTGECGAVVAVAGVQGALDRISAVAGPSDAVSMGMSGGQMTFSVESVAGVTGKASSQCPVESGRNWSTGILIAHRLLSSTMRAMSGRVKISFDSDITLGHVVRVEPIDEQVVTRIGLARMRAM